MSKWKICLIVIVFIGATSPAYPAAGDLDPSFDDDGIVTTGFQLPSLASANSTFVQPDGKVVAAGSVFDVAGTDLALVRYNQNGTLDPSFGSNGQVVIDFGSGNEFINDAALQSDGKIIVGGFSGAPPLFALARFNADGTPDISFGQSGVVKLFDGVINGIALQPDGKIVAAGGTGVDFAVARYNADGSPDISFGGGDGFVSFNVSPAGGDIPDEANAVTIQPDNKIIVAGHASNSLRDFAIARLNPDGTLDSSFSNDGIVLTHIAGSEETYTILIQPDGKLVAVGNTFTGTGFEVVAARYTNNGDLDTSFDGDGILNLDEIDTDFEPSGVLQSDGKIIVAGTTITFGDNFNFIILRVNSDGAPDCTFGVFCRALVDFGSDDVASSTTIAPDGTLIVAGTSHPSESARDFAVARILTNGILDSTFGSNGKVNTTVNGSSVDFSGMPNGMAIQNNGQIIVAGSAQSRPGQIADPFRSDFAVLARYNPDGTLDSSFGTGGITLTQLAFDFNAVLALQSDGKVLVGGTVEDKFAMIRYEANGNLDPTFGSGGVALSAFQGEANAGVLQTDGKMILAGQSINFGSMSLVRFNNDGSVDTSFGGNGIAIADFGAPSEGFAVQVQPDGRIVVAGESDGGIALARFNSDGSLDSTFGLGDGLVVEDFFRDEDRGFAVVIRPDGKIIVGGTTQNPNPPAGADFALAQFNSDGTLDPNFGNGGKITTDFLFINDAIRGIVLQPDGKIVAAGVAEFEDPNLGDPALALARYNSDGTLDTTFGESGKVTTSITGNDARSVALQADGKIVASGVVRSLKGDSDFVIYRYLNDPGGANDLLVDDFENGVLDWDIEKGNWTESGGVLTGTGSPKALAFAPLPWNPSGLSECSICTVETTVRISGGNFSRVFIDGWFQNGGNKVELVIKEGSDKLILKQKSGGGIVTKAKADAIIDTDVNYTISISFDGTRFRVLLDGAEAINTQAGAAPSGNVGFNLKNTAASISQIRVF